MIHKLFDSDIIFFEFQIQNGRFELINASNTMNNLIKFINKFQKEFNCLIYSKKTPSSDVSEKDRLLLIDDLVQTYNTGVYTFPSYLSYLIPWIQIKFNNDSDYLLFKLKYAEYDMEIV